MAISAVFRADFTHLVQEIKNVEVKFEQFQHKTEDVQGTIARFADKFSGSKLISEAEMMAGAIDKIGGVSQLTEREAARVGKTLEEAMEKAQRTGQPVSETMRRVAEQTQQAANKGGVYNTVINSISSAAKTAMASLGAMFALNQLINFATRIVQFGGEMTDLAAKTGLSTTALQQFQYAGGQVGVELSSITSGVNMLQKRLAGDDKSAKDAVERLGLSFGDFKRLTPEEQFRQIAERVGAIEDPMQRTKAATDLFGRSGAELLPALTREFGALTEKANSLGIVMDEETVSAMDNLGDVVGDLGNVALASLARIIQPFIPLLSTLAQALTFVADISSRVVAFAVGHLTDRFREVGNMALNMARSMLEGMRTVSDAVPGLDSLTGSSSALTTAIGYLDRAQQSLNTTQPAVKTNTHAVAVEMEAASRETDKNQKAVNALVGELTGAGAIQQVKNLEAAFRQLTPEQRANDGVVREVLERYQKLRPVVGDEMAPAVEQLFRQTGTLETKTRDLSAAMIELRPSLQDSSDEIRRATELTTLSWKEVAEAKKKTNEWAFANGAVLAPSIDSMNISIEESETATIDWRTSLDGLVRTFEQAATIGGDTFRGLVQWLGNVLAASKMAKEGGEAFKKSLEGLKGSKDQAVGSALNLAASALSVVSAMDQATASGSTLERTIGGVNTGFAAGNAILPGVGGAIGAVAGGLVGLFRGLSSVSEETKKVRGEIASFEEGLRKNLTTTQAAEAAGRGWAATTIAVRDAYMLTGRSAADAEAIVKQLWDDKNPNAARAAIEQINKVMEEAKRIAEELDRELNGALGEAVELGIQLPEHLAGSIEQLIAMGKITGDNATLFGQLTAQTEPNFKKMEEAAKKYGVELGALGPAFAQNQLNERARDIIDSFETMKRGGADVGGVIAGMSDEINQFVQDAISSGRQVPENMKPIIEAMIEQGRLTDANGTKLTDMSGINFGPPVESAFDRIIKKLEELIAKIGGGMGFDQATAQAQNFATQATTAISNIPRNIPIRFEAGGDDVNNDGDPGFATGTLGRTGRWFQNFGGGTLTMLHGEEAVVRKDQAGAFAQAFGGGGAATVEELRALRSDLMAMPQHLARAVRDALLVAG